MQENFQLQWSDVLEAAIYMGLFTIALWVIYFIDAVIRNHNLKNLYGLVPRGELNPAIFISPFLHVDRRHLAANSIPFFILGTLVMVQGQLIFWLTTLVIIIVSGFGIWIFGKSGTRHVGASGLILGYFGYLLSSAFFISSTATIIFAVTVGVFYLGLIRQIVPLQEGVSTTSHLFGFVGGIIAAAIVSGIIVNLQ